MAKYSVILPVKNGGEYIKECINSIRAQTLGDFNLIVLIHDCNDGTLDWLNAISDPRLIIHNAQNIDGIIGNWNRIRDIPKNEFMTIIGYDDLLDPGYLATMDKLISEYPDASLYQSHYRYIDSKGKLIRPSKPMKEKQMPAEVLGGFLSNKTDICGTGFMMRSMDYERVGGIPPYPNLLFADFALWIDLSLISYMAVAKEELFAFRLHQSTTTISSDQKMEKAFAEYIAYLERISKNDKVLGKVVSQHANELLNFYCQGLTSRLLRTSLAKRSGKRVKDIINDFKLYAIRLNPEKEFLPLSNITIKMALLVDSNPVTRNFFLLFKKIYPKPVAG